MRYITHYGSTYLINFSLEIIYDVIYTLTHLQYNRDFYKRTNDTIPTHPILMVISILF